MVKSSRKLQIENFRATVRDFKIQIQEAQLLQVSGSLAYVTILSLIPLLAVSFAVFQTFGGLDKLYQVIEPFIIENLAKESGQHAMQAIRNFIGNVRATTVGGIGFIGLIITCMSMLSSAEKAVNKVWKSEITRPIFQRIAAYWFFITIGPIAFAIGLASITSNQMKFTSGLPHGTGAFFLSILIFTIIYKWTPNRKVNWSSAFVPALSTTLLLGAARLGYRLYVQKVVAYNKIYGSLGAIPILLVWIYVIWIIVLFGAALGAAMQRKLDLK